MHSFRLPRLAFHSKKLAIGISVVILAFSLQVSGHELVLESSVQQTGLLELYTSEGCSSCPPADRFVSSLLDRKDLWSTFVPIALHVDYWDYIGWQDRFASPVYSQRQRRYAEENALKTVYTPGFVYNGREWRNWFARRFRDFPKGGKPGILKLTLENGSAKILFTPGSIQAGIIEVHLALLGFNIETRVKAGENRGKTLTHNFVVLALENEKLTFTDGGYTGELQLPETAINAERYALAAWVNRPDVQAPLQAVGGWLE